MLDMPQYTALIGKSPGQIAELDAATRITNRQKPGTHITRDTCERCGGLGCSGGCPCDCPDCNPRTRR